MTNQEGEPLEGYRLTVYQKDMPSQLSPEGSFSRNGEKHRPSTTFTFPIDEIYVLYVVYDYFDNHIITLFDGILNSDIHQILWNGEDEEGNKVRDGIYKADIRNYDPENLEEPLSSEINLMYIFREFDWGQSPQVTDENGYVEDDSILSYPVLYFEYTIPIISEDGQIVGEIIFNEITCISVYNGDDDEPLMNHDFQIKNGANRIDLQLE